MLWRRNLSIRQKLQGIVMVTCGVALVVATVAFTFYDRATFLSAKTDDLVTSAGMIGANSTAALTFNDPNSAREALSALRAKQDIMNAAYTTRLAKSSQRIAETRPTPDSLPLQPKEMEPPLRLNTSSCSRASFCMVIPLARFTSKQI